MASSAGLAVQPNKARSGLTSSFQRSYGTVKSSSPSISASGRLATGSVSVHRVQEEDTLQGLAVRYGVTVGPAHYVPSLPPSLPPSLSLSLSRFLFFLAPWRVRVRVRVRWSASVQDAVMGDCVLVVCACVLCSV